MESFLFDKPAAAIPVVLGIFFNPQALFTQCYFPWPKIDFFFVEKKKKNRYTKIRLSFSCKARWGSLSEAMFERILVK